MVDSDFISLVFEKHIIFLFIFVLVSGIIYLGIYRMKVSLLHPFAYFCLLLNATSYSVVILFVTNMNASLAMVSYIAFAAVAMISCLRFGYAAAPRNLDRVFASAISVSEAKKIYPFFICMFIALFCVYLLSGANTIATESRFEAATGMGFIIRLIEAAAVIVMCFSAVRTDNKLFVSSPVLGVTFFALSLTVVAGSKGGILEALLWYVFLTRKLGKKVSGYKVVAWASVAVFTAVTVLWYNLKEMGFDVANILGTYSDLPFVVERLIIRLIANGDMYYFTLVPGVEQSISVEYGPYQIPFQILGSGVVSRLFGVDLPNNEPGRQAFLYWYPSAPMGGPTNHLDLAFYFYLGPVMGLIGVAATSFIIGWLHGVVTKSTGYTYTTAFFMVLYCKILLAFASPSVAAQRLFDAGILLISAVVAIKLLHAVCRPTMRSHYVQ